jgi:hypothetical protein
MESLTVVLALAALVALVLVSRPAYLRHRAKAAARAEHLQEREVRINHVYRLASEISEVSLTIEADLAPFRSIPALGRLQTRSRRLRLRAEAVVTPLQRLHDLPWFELDANVAEAHANHLRMVALRAVADSEIRNWRKHVRANIEETRSSWPFITTPLSSGMDA